MVICGIQEVGLAEKKERKKERKNSDIPVISCRVMSCLNVLLKIRSLFFAPSVFIHSMISATFLIALGVDESLHVAFKFNITNSLLLVLSTTFVAFYSTLLSYLWHQFLIYFVPHNIGSRRRAGGGGLNSMCQRCRAFSEYNSLKKLLYVGSGGLS